MKVGTVTKVIVGAAAIIGVAFIGVHHFISSKEDSSPSVEIITSTSAPRTDFDRKRVVTAHRPENEPRISVEEMEQIENFFNQLEEADAQDLEKKKDVFPSEMDSEVALDTSVTQVVSEPQEERIFGLTLSEIEAQIPVLEDEIRTNLTQAVDLYLELKSTDEIGAIPEVAEWREETWDEVNRLWREIYDKTVQYIRYALVIDADGLRENSPLVEGGWIHELSKPLPMEISSGVIPSAN